MHFHFSIDASLLLRAVTIFLELQTRLRFAAAASLLLQPLALSFLKSLHAFNLFPEAICLFLSCLRLESDIAPDIREFSQDPFFLRRPRVCFRLCSLKYFHRQAERFLSSSTVNVGLLDSVTGFGFSTK